MLSGFWPHYKDWVHHGEEISSPSSFSYDKGDNTHNTQSRGGFGEINTMGILNDILGCAKVMEVAYFIKRVTWMKRKL